MYRALTVAREYESGGDRIAALVAKRLGWKLLDSALIEEIANLAHVDPQLAREFDERVDSWLHRVSRRALWHGAFEAVAVLPETEVFDAETMALLARAAIETRLGNRQLRHRGARQASASCRTVRMSSTFSSLRPSATVRPGARHPRRCDERARYVQMNFGQDWRDPHLYDLMISSKLGDERVVSTILSGMGNPV